MWFCLCLSLIGLSVSLVFLISVFLSFALADSVLTVCITAHDNHLAHTRPHYVILLVKITLNSVQKHVHTPLYTHKIVCADFKTASKG